MSNPSNWTSHLEKWPQNHNVGPICVHAEGDTTANIILMAKGRPLHICHVARKSELGMYFPQFSIKKLFLEYYIFLQRSSKLPKILDCLLPVKYAHTICF